MSKMHRPKGATSPSHKIVPATKPYGVQLPPNVTQEDWDRVVEQVKPTLKLHPGLALEQAVQEVVEAGF